MRTGGCQCGRVRFWLSQEPLSLIVCHCTECRKQSASAFGLSIPVWEDALSLDGRLERWQRQTATGATLAGFYCPACGSRLYHQSTSSAGTLTLKGGTLDDLTGVDPAAHIWTRSRLPWVVLDPQVPAWETQPEDMTAWRAAMLPPRSV